MATTEKLIKSRQLQKIDTTENWNTAGARGFVPLKGEIIVYSDENKIKIGDGKTTVNNLPFASFSGKWEDIEGKPFTTQSIEGTTSALSEDFEIYDWYDEGEDEETIKVVHWCDGDINVIENKQYAVYINTNKYVFTAKHYYDYEDQGEGEPVLAFEYLYLGESIPSIHIPIRNSEVSIDEVTITATEEITNFQVYPYEEIDIINEDSIPDTITRVEDINWNNLKDKPFEVTTEAGPIFSENFEPIFTGSSGETDPGVGCDYYDLNETVTIIPGQSYTVIYNTVTYHCVANDDYTLGQYLRDGATIDTVTYPFYLTTRALTVIYGCDIETFSVSLDNPIIKTLDEKFIPDTIARVEDIPEGITAEDVSNQIAAAAVRYDEAQDLAEDEKITARGNIGIDTDWLRMELSNELFSIGASDVTFLDDSWSEGASIRPLSNPSDGISVLEVASMSNSEMGVRLRGLAAGSQDTDAVNVKQLNTAIADAKSYIDETILGGAW